MKYTILIHSNPQPWDHPTQLHTAEGKELPAQWHEESEARFEALMKEIVASGEFVTAEALGDPQDATLFGWTPGGPTVPTDGPYAEAKEHLAGFFLIDCSTRERAEQIAAQFAQPGGTVELRPAMWTDADN